MKVLYFRPSYLIDNLYRYLPAEEITAYEIVHPERGKIGEDYARDENHDEEDNADHDGSENIDSDENKDEKSAENSDADQRIIDHKGNHKVNHKVNQIILEEDGATRAKYKFVMGEGNPDMEDLLQILQKTEIIEQKLQSVLKPGEHFIFVDSNFDEKEMEVLSALVKEKEKPVEQQERKQQEQRDYHIHLIHLIDEKVRTENPADLLCMASHLEALDSVAFVNFYEIAGEKNYILKHNEDLDFFRDLLGEAIAKVVSDTVRYVESTERGLNEESSVPVIAVYDPKRRTYLNARITEEDLKNSRTEADRFFRLRETIAPNKGKETCHRLKDYRSRYRLQHKIKNMEERKCENQGVCQGTCSYCDAMSENLWELGQVEPSERKYYPYGFYPTSRIHPLEDELYDKNPPGGFAEICGISRLRENLDGPGIRSLVLMHSCPLQCKYCINKDFISKLPLVHKVSVGGLSHAFYKDAIYYEATGGGITFGGGEPLLYPEFIHQFHAHNPKWSLAVETSLSVSFEAIDQLAEDIDLWIVDVKDLNPDIYRHYTGGDISLLKMNLSYLLTKVSSDKIICRLPLIPGFTREEDRDRSEQTLREMGYTRFDRFTYETL